MRIQIILRKYFDQLFLYIKSLKCGAQPISPSISLCKNSTLDIFQLVPIRKNNEMILMMNQDNNSKDEHMFVPEKSSGSTGKTLKEKK